MRWFCNSGIFYQEEFNKLQCEGQGVVARSPSGRDCFVDQEGFGVYSSRVDCDRPSDNCKDMVSVAISVQKNERTVLFANHQRCPQFSSAGQQPIFCSQSVPSTANPSATPTFPSQPDSRGTNGTDQSLPHPRRHFQRSESFCRRVTPRERAAIYGARGRVAALHSTRKQNHIRRIRV